MASLLPPSPPRNLSVRKKISSHLKLLRKKSKIYKEWKETWAEDRKDFSEVYHDIVRLIWEYNVPFSMIFPGYWEEHMHKKGNPLEEYVIWREWDMWRKYLDWQCHENYKKLYSKEETIELFSEHNIPCPALIGFLVWNRQEGKPFIIKNDETQISLREAMNEYGGLFIKPDDMVQGKGCAKIQLTDDGSYLVNDTVSREEELVDLFQVSETKSVEKLQVERLIVQHRDLAAIHPSSVNTLRLITIKDSSGNITLSRSLLRMGIGGRSVDNWCTGGLAVRINEDGTLEENGWFEKPNRGPQAVHPDTGIRFKGYALPYWEEAVRLVLHAHNTLVPDLFGVGWDVAITSTGPILIEANPNFSIFQPICGGMRPMLEQYLKPMCMAVMHGQKPLIHYNTK